MESFGQKTFDYMDTTLVSYMASAFGGLSSSVKGLMVTVTGLFLVAVGYGLLMGFFKERTKEAAISLGLCVVLSSIIFDAGAYASWVVAPIKGTVADLCSFFVGVGGGSDLHGLFNNLDNTLGMIMTTIDRLDPPGSLLTNAWLYVKVGAASFLLALAFALAYLCYLALMIVSFFAINLMLLVGVIFIPFAAFKETRFVAWNWLRATANYGLGAVFLTIIMSILGQALQASANDLSNWDLARDGVFTQQYGAALFLSALTIWLLLKAADFASAITLGSGPSGGGFVGGGLMMAGRSFSSGLKTISGPTGSAAASAGRWGAGTAATAGIRAYSRLKGLMK
jgi:type IV secretion system protein VirB6